MSYKDKEQLIDEIGEDMLKATGCIIFDLSCYFPYSNQEILTFNFKLGEEKLEPYKHNHRFPNKGYVTISKKTGRRVSKLGYPAFVEFDKEQIILLGIEAGIRDNTINLVFPVQVTLTKEKPVCALTLRFHFDESNFEIISPYRAENGGYRKTIWTNHEIDDNGVIFMENPERIEDSYTAIYSDVITPYPQSLDNLMIW